MHNCSDCNRKYKTEYRFAEHMHKAHGAAMPEGLTPGKRDRNDTGRDGLKRKIARTMTSVQGVIDEVRRVVGAPANEYSARATHALSEMVGQLNLAAALPEASETAESTCVVCLDARPSLVITACGHLCLCADCGQSLTACPMCRAAFDATQLVRVFAA